MCIFAFKIMFIPGYLGHRQQKNVMDRYKIGYLQALSLELHPITFILYPFNICQHNNSDWPSGQLQINSGYQRIFKTIHVKYGYYYYRLQPLLRLAFVQQQYSHCIKITDMTRKKLHVQLLHGRKKKYSHLNGCGPISQIFKYKSIIITI